MEKMGKEESPAMTRDKASASLKTSANLDTIPSKPMLPDIADDTKSNSNLAAESHSSTNSAVETVPLAAVVDEGHLTGHLVDASPMEHSKDDSEGSEGCGSAVADADHDKVENGNESRKGWASMAPLYCKSNGRSHATLLDFDIWRCPSCDEDLDPPKNIETSSDSGGDAGTSTDEDDEPTKQAISHVIQFLDSDDGVMQTASWEKPFDLATAREGVSFSNHGSIFDVVTMLQDIHTGFQRLPVLR